MTLALPPDVPPDVPLGTEKRPPAAAPAGGQPMRTMAVWCPDWGPSEAWDPEVVGPAAAARAFEPVVAAVEQVAAGVAVTAPGRCAVAARGPARHAGSEECAAERIVDRVAEECVVEAQVGVADGEFAAALAARTGRVVPPGESAAFLAPAPVEELGRPALADLLHRLGIRTLGQFAQLPAADVLTRFGFDAALAHRLAQGIDHRLLAVRRPPPELAVVGEYDEPLERVDTAAFAARALAQELSERLTGYGLACTRLVVEARTCHGEVRTREWRHDGPLTTAAVTDRVRWQLEGWLASAGAAGTSGAAGAPTAGICRLRLAPAGVVRQAGLQPGLWGEPGEAAARAGRAFARVQGLLGSPESVVTAVPAGGRGPADRVRWVPWGEEPPAAPDAGAPWPGGLPAPPPAAVWPDPVAVTLVDDAGAPVAVDGRLHVSGAPAWCAVGHRAPCGVAAWSGPWPVTERWWDPPHGTRAVWCQVCLTDGRALLLACAQGAWRLVASYD